MAQADPPSSPTVTAVICTRNRPELALQAASSVLTNDGIDYELMIVDQSDDDATERALEGLPLRYIKNPTRGRSISLNLAIRSSSSPYLAITDDDCTAPDDWLVRGVKALEAYPEAAMCFGQVVAPQELAGVGGIPQMVFSERRLIGGPHGFELAMDACMVARRSVFEHVGPFDEILTVGGPLGSSEDFDFQWRAHRERLVTLLEPTLRVFHYGSRDEDEWGELLRRYGHGDAALFSKLARCRDPLAVRLLREPLRAVTRELTHHFLGKGCRRPYLAGWLAGFRDSMRFGVDRRARLYRAR